MYIYIYTVYISGVEIRDLTATLRERRRAFFYVILCGGSLD